MKTTQPASTRKETVALSKVLRSFQKVESNPSFSVETLPLDRRFLAKDLALEVFNASPVTRVRGSGLHYDMVTEDGEKAIVLTRKLSRSAGANYAVTSSGNALYPLQYAKEYLPDFIVLVVLNQYRDTIDLFEFPFISENGSVRATVGVSYSFSKRSYGSNERFLVRSFSPNLL
jgi:hypothetical protein